MRRGSRVACLQTSPAPLRRSDWAAASKVSGLRRYRSESRRSRGGRSSRARGGAAGAGPRPAHAIALAARGCSARGSGVALFAVPVARMRRRDGAAPSVPHGAVFAAPRVSLLERDRDPGGGARSGAGARSFFGAGLSSAARGVSWLTRRPVVRARRRALGPRRRRFAATGRAAMAVLGAVTPAQAPRRGALRPARGRARAALSERGRVGTACLRTARHRRRAVLAPSQYESPAARAAALRLEPAQARRAPTSGERLGERAAAARGLCTAAR
jgi:hypothetical protein